MNKHTAFSLIEFVVSLSIALILFSVTIPQFFDNANYQLKHELEHLAITCAYLQRKAIASNRSLELVFDQAAQRYTYPGRNNQIQTRTLNQMVKFGFFADAKGPPSEPKKLIRHAVTFDYKKKEATALFLPKGKITPGSIYLVTKDKKHMGAVTCSLSKLAIVRKYIYLKKKWQRL